MIVTITLATLVSTFVGLLLGIHLGRRFYGLTDRWDGWDAEIDWLMKALRR